jgi:hypothetical protein
MTKTAKTIIAPSVMYKQRWRLGWGAGGKAAGVASGAATLESFCAATGTESWLIAARVGAFDKTSAVGMELSEVAVPRAFCVAVSEGEAVTPKLLKALLKASAV